MLKKDVIRRANEFCKEHNIESYPVNIIKICNSIGLKVFEEYLPKDVSGFIMIQDEIFPKYKTNKVIGINLSDSPKRRRFTIAHELAHYVLHKDKNDNLYAHRDAGQSNSIEYEANTFASCILMPEALVRDELNSFTKISWGDIPLFVKVDHIAYVFAVSKSAAEVRLSQLGIR